MPTKKEMVEELKTLGVEASVEEKTSDLQAKLDTAKAPPTAGAQGAGTPPTPPAAGETAPEAKKKPAKTQPVLKGGVYHKGVQYEAGTVCPPELVETFRELGEIVDKVV